MEKVKVPVRENVSSDGMHRRRFLGILGGSASVVAVAAACNHDDNNSTPYDGAVVDSNGTLDLGRGDIGILNYAYALEQLEAAFYTQVVATPYAGISIEELTYLTDIRDHEIAHREFFKAALGTKGIPDGTLKVNFTAINFSDRTSVLGTAQAFENLGVSAYNGAGQLIVSADYLLVAGKIVSVEARHAAYISDLISYGTFAANPPVDATSGLDKDNTTTYVLSVAQNYLITKVSGANLPTA